MNILFISSEVAPYSKTGGLGDVLGSLPAALAARGHDVMVVSPLYGSAKVPALENLGAQVRLKFPFGEPVAELKGLRLSERHEVVFLDCPAFYARPGLYGDAGGDYADNHRRFAFLSVGGLSAAQVLGFDADIVHLNDWQTGLAPVALRRGFEGTPLASAKSVFTIHNLAYQGMFHKGVMDDLGLPWDLFRPDGLEFYDAVNFLKSGLAFADALTTVSPRYAQEIQTPEGGANLDGLLRARRGSLHGILNGIDYDEWNPRTDKYLPAHYDADELAGKWQCKRALLERLGLPHDDAAMKRPVFGMVSRLAEQKGVDLLLAAMEQFLPGGDAVFVGLGSGDPSLETALWELAKRFPRNAGVWVGFDAALSHQVEAGADFFVMPSRYEPCGLNQMYSLRYGTLPIVRATGGLDDTVEDLSSPNATGLKFQDFDLGQLLRALWRARDAYHNAAAWLDTVRQRGMRQDFSWGASAARYEALYRSLTGKS
ncbi:MAG TPA: glycogen synthase GlgA [Myxococcaceae bacterium]|nr:glycogen synthase GlgA [Myxococcaceae bacterium]